MISRTINRPILSPRELANRWFYKNVDCAHGIGGTLFTSDHWDARFQDEGYKLVMLIILGEDDRHEDDFTLRGSSWTQLAQRTKALLPELTTCCKQDHDLFRRSHE